MNAALGKLVQPYQAGSLADRPIELSITTTLLRGVPGVVTDSMGQRIGQTRHDGLFRFRRGPTHPEVGGDDFATAQVAAAPPGGVIPSLALAARSTASYPVAFEPSYLPTSPKTSEAADELRPDVAAYLSGAWDQSQEGLKRSRYVVDGGVLANTPTRPAMEAVDAMPAEGLVRRVMLLVHPHAPAVVADHDDEVGKPFSVVGAGRSLLKALTSEGGRNFVDLIERHNRDVGVRRELRGDIVRRVLDDHTAADPSAEALALYGLYRRLRLRAAAADLAGLWLSHPSNSERRSATTVAAEILEELGGGTTGRGAKTAKASSPYLPAAPTTLPPPHLLGVPAAIGVADAAVDYLRRAMWAVKADDEASARVADARGRVSDARNELLALRREDDERLRSTAASDIGLSDWLTAARRLSRQTSSRLVEPLEKIEQAVASARVDRDQHGGDRALEGFVTALFGQDDSEGAEDDAATEVLDRLNELQVLTHVVAPEVTSGNALPIDLVQLTYQVEHPFASELPSGEDKVAGDQMARFSAFLKRSWRVNDWTWGRLDAARVLCETVLEPDRVHRYLSLKNPDCSEGRAAELATTILKLVDAPEGLRAEMGLPTVDELRHELLEVQRDEAAQLSRLPAVFAAALALEIAADELPRLPAAVDHDLAEGGNQRSRGAVAMKAGAEVLKAARDGGTPERWGALRQFATTGLGREAIADEATSDQMIRTATTATATTVSMLDGDRSGLGALSPVTRPLRGAALLPYWTLMLLTGGNAIARSLAQLGLAVGGVLVVLGLVGVAPTWATTAGAGAVLVAFAYGALRSGTMLHGVVLLGAALVVLALAMPEATEAPGEEATPTTTEAEQLDADGDGQTDPGGDEEATEGDREAASITVVVAAVALVLGLFLLGSLSPPILGPVAWLKRFYPHLLLLISMALVAWVVFTAWEVEVGQRTVTWEGLPEWLPKFAATVSQAGSGLPTWTQVGVWAVALSVPAVIGGLLARRVAVRSKVLVLAPPDGAAKKRKWKETTSQDSAPVTAGWAVVYGVLVGAGGLAILMLPDEVSTRFALIGGGLVVGAVVLTVAVPLRLLFTSAKRLRHRAKDAFADAQLAETDTEEAKVGTLFAAGCNYRLLVRIRDRGPNSGSSPGFDQLELTGTAKRALETAAKSSS
jgi:patatin-related protein